MKALLFILGIQFLCIQSIQLIFFSMSCYAEENSEEQKSAPRTIKDLVDSSTKAQEGVNPNQHVDSMTLREAEEAIFSDLNNRVRFYLEANLYQLRFLTDCLRVPSWRLSGDEKKYEECKAAFIDIQKSIEIDYPRVRRRQFLINAFVTSPFTIVSAIQNNFESQMDKIVRANVALGRTDYFQIDAKNPFQGAIGAFQINKRNLYRKMTDQTKVFELPEVPWTEEESLKFLDGEGAELYGYNDIFLKVCQKFVKKHVASCDNIKLKYEKGLGFYFSFPAGDTTIQAAVREMWQVDVNWSAFTGGGGSGSMFLPAYGMASLIGDKLEEDYFSTAEKAAYLTMLSSVQPSRHQLFQVLNFMRSQAALTLKDHKEYTKKLKDSSNNIRDEKLRLMSYAPVVQSLKDSLPSIEQVEKYGKDQASAYSDEVDIDVLIDSLQQDYDMLILKELGGQMALLIGGNIALCTLGPAKFLKWKRLKKMALLGRAGITWENIVEIISPVCLPANLAINTWYTFGSMQIYNQAYQEIFSAVSDATNVRPLNSLKESENAVALNLAFYVLAFLPKNHVDSFTEVTDIVRAQHIGAAVDKFLPGLPQGVRGRLIESLVKSMRGLRNISAGLHKKDSSLAR